MRRRRPSIVVAGLSSLTAVLGLASPGESSANEAHADPMTPVAAYATVDGFWDGPPRIVSAGDRTLAAWDPWDVCNPLVVISDDGGVTWSEPAQLKSNTGTDDFSDADPVLTGDGNGTWVAIWPEITPPLGHWSVFFARSVDDGETWSPPQLLSQPTGAFDYESDIATGGNGTWVAVLSGLGISWTRSVDNGESWSSPVQFASGLENRSPAIATDGAGTWIIVWSSWSDFTDEPDKEILYVRSQDDGATWSPIRTLDDPVGSNLTDYFADIAVDPAGTWVVAWRAFVPGASNSDYDLLYTRSTDGGLTWSVPSILNSDAAIDGLDEDDEEVTLTYAGNDQWLAAWVADRATREIHTARSSDGAVTWEPVESLDLPSGFFFEVSVTARSSGNALLAFSSTMDPDGVIGTDYDVFATRLRIPFDSTCAGDADADGYAATGDADCPLGPLVDCDDTDITIAPGAVDSCDGVNNDCTHPSWPSLAGTNEADDDGDGISECEGDCDDGDALVWSVPGLVSQVVVGRAGSIAQIMWETPAEPGGHPATLVYDVIRGEAPFACGLSGTQTCVETDDGADRIAEDPLVPEPGEVFFYQVRAENRCGRAGFLEFVLSWRPRVAIDCD